MTSICNALFPLHMTHIMVIRNCSFLRRSHLCYAVVRPRQHSAAEHVSGGDGRSSAGQWRAVVYAGISVPEARGPPKSDQGGAAGRGRGTGGHRSGNIGTPGAAANCFDTNYLYRHRALAGLSGKLANAFRAHQYFYLFRNDVPLKANVRWCLDIRLSFTNIADRVSNLWIIFTEMRIVFNVDGASS